MIIPITDNTVPNGGSYEKDETLRIGVKSMQKKEILRPQRIKFNIKLGTASRGIMVADEGAPLATLGPEERLYILGHSSSGDNLLSGKTPSELLDHLIKRGLDLMRPLKIVLVSCNAGSRLTGKSFAEIFFAEAFTRIEKKLSWDNMQIDINYKAKNNGGHTLWVKAPKGMISFSNLHDLKPHILPPEFYPEYQKLKLNLDLKKIEEADLEEWLQQKMRITLRTDWQFLPESSAQMHWGLGGENPAAP
ncbi:MULTISPECIES: hypothetical protein [Pseudomonas]|uniref:hypothetical protein n=1 Tax=Pseudomonas TaxID=286 RepID=UPI00070D2CAF|nr:MULTISPECIES: hypothetical protein [Pseudomonas]KQW09373.1 hypothetical protein ASC85_13535 [Pseudomonas sp. Root401]WHS55509.1 hypothetical protein QLH64_05935 [Pseudomonas brassicacearum]